MKCLIVTAHPLQDSLCMQIELQICGQLQEQGHEVNHEDLYASSFNPALTTTERATYYADTYDSSELTTLVNNLQSAEALILVFPTWWFGFPAILKGWFDRVWGPGIAFDNTDDFGPIVPRLDNLRKTMVVTTLGSPWWVDRLIMRQPVKRVVKTALLGACATNSSLQFLSLYESEKTDDKKLQRFMRKVSHAVNTWSL